MRWVQLVAHAAAAAAREREVSQVIEVVLACTASLGATSATFYRPAPSGDALWLAGQRNLSGRLAGRLAEIPFSSPSLAALAARERRIQVVEAPDTLPENLELSRAVMAEQRHQAVLALPLLLDGRLVGVLVIGLPRPHRFTEEELDAIQAISDAFASALENARRLEHERSESSLLRAVRAAALAIASPLELPEVLRRIVDEARKVAGAEFAALGLLEGPVAPRTFGLWMVSGTGAPLGRLPPHPLGLLGREGAVRIGAPTDPRLASLPEGYPPMRSFLGVEIQQAGAPVGHLYLANKRSAAEFTGEDALAIEWFAQHAAIAVVHGRDHQKLQEEVRRREASEQARAESEARFRRLAENAADVIFRIRLRPTTRVEYLSPAVARVLGHAPEAYVKQPGLLLGQLHPEDAPLLYAATRRAEGPGTVTLRVRHADGEQVWVEARYSRLLDAAGNLEAVEGIVRDVTMQKRAEKEVQSLLEAMRARRTWLQTVIDESPVGILLAEDRLGKRITTNRIAEALLGRPLRKDGGPTQYLDQLKHPDGTPFRAEEMALVRALDGEATASEELLCARPDGNEIPVLVNGTPIRDEAGQVIGAVVVMRDITRLKELERQREEWTSIVAHDLRQPVNVISLQASALVRRAPEPSTQERAQHILASARQLSRLILDLLDVSRLEARNLSLLKQPVQVPQLAREVLERIQPDAPTRPLRLVSEGALPTVSADPIRLEQVLGNLVSNALKYGLDESPVEVRLEPSGGGIAISVTNVGDPISPEDLPQLFERFRRTQRAKQKRVPGLGLGLYIARGLVEAHGGRIGVTSAEGKTRFWFTLPCCEQAALQPAP